MRRRASWRLHLGSPVIELWLHDPFAGFKEMRTLLADTGAGDQGAPFDLILSQRDGAQFGGRIESFAGASGAIRGRFPVVAVEVEIPALLWTQRVLAIIVPPENLFPGVDGFACFRFLNSFSYGNFGDPNTFSLETL